MRDDDFKMALKLVSQGINQHIGLHGKPPSLEEVRRRLDATQDAIIEARKRLGAE